MREYAAAVRALELVLKYHPCGLAVLLGSYPPPDAETWDEILSMDRPSSDPVYVSGGSRESRILACVAAADDMEGIIKSMGGWHNVNQCAQALRMEQSTLWNHFVAHLDRVEGSRSTRCGEGDQSPREKLAAELGITPKTLTIHRYTVLRLIARKAMNRYFQLSIQ